MRFRPTEIVAMTAAVIACMGAVVSALVPALYAFSSRNRELDIRLVEIGISILRADPKEKQTQSARQCAITVIENFSGRKFSAEAKAELLDHKLDGSFDLGYRYIGTSYDLGGGYAVMVAGLRSPHRERILNRENKMLRRAVPLTWLLISVAHAESVDVKYRGPVDLAPFTCMAVSRSSFIKRVCYDKREQYMVINLNGTYYHYCEIDDGTVSSLMAADSMGRFYNASIKGRFDCRVNRMPKY